MKHIQFFAGPQNVSDKTSIRTVMTMMLLLMAM